MLINYAFPKDSPGNQWVPTRMVGAMLDPTLRPWAERHMIRIRGVKVKVESTRWTASLMLVALTFLGQC